MIKTYKWAWRHDAEILLVRLYIEQFMRMIRVFSDNKKPSKSAFTDWENQIVFDVSWRVVRAASLDAALLSIFEVEKVHLQTVQYVDLACVY